MTAATQMLDTFEDTLAAMRGHLEMAEKLADACHRPANRENRPRRVLMSVPRTNGTIRASDHIALLHRILQHYRLPPGCLDIVPDVYAWSWAHQIPETRWLRQAKCIDLGEGRCVIAIRWKLHDSMVSARKVAMELLGLNVAALDSRAKYIAHLLLREIAYVVLKSDDEKYCDEWALAELPKRMSLAALH